MVGEFSRELDIKAVDIGDNDIAAADGGTGDGAQQAIILVKLHHGCFFAGALQFHRLEAVGKAHLVGDGKEVQEPVVRLVKAQCASHQSPVGAMSFCKSRQRAVEVELHFIVGFAHNGAGHAGSRAAPAV